MQNPADTVREATRALAVAPSDLAGISAFDLTDLLTAFGEHERAVARFSALASGELARRSRRELGTTGLAQAAGFRTPEAMIQSIAGTTATEASALVRVGSLLVDDPASPVSAAVAGGALTVDAADAIRGGLGRPDAATSSVSLDAAAARIIAAGLEHRYSPDELRRLAREARDELDELGIARRELERHEMRYFRARRRDDGMVAGSFLLDQEAGGLLLSAIDTILSPRRGGPRFVDLQQREKAEALVADPRTNDQLAADALTDIVKLAVDADPNKLFGARRPAVRVIVTEHALKTRIGHGELEGAADPIALETVDRHLCSTGFMGIRFDSPNDLNLGRTQRLFSGRQGVGLAVRDAGCLISQCPRPPSMCEAHHINQWDRDEGKTDLGDGVLLCRYHHQGVHTTRRRISRRDGRYWLGPPGVPDGSEVGIPLESKSRLVRQLIPQLAPVSG